MSSLLSGSSITALARLASVLDLLPEQGEVAAEAAQAQHHHVGSKALQAVTCVGIRAQQGLLVSDMVNNLVLPLPECLVITEDDLCPIAVSVL